jgi:hypothetical protein
MCWREACGAISDRVRITAQLIRSSDQTHLWARAYDRELKDFNTCFKPHSTDGHTAPRAITEKRARGLHSPQIRGWSVMRN